MLTLNALVAVDEVFIPLQPHFLALHGLSKLLETINLVSVRLNPRLKISGVVLCMYDVNTRLAGEVSDNVDQFFRSARDKTTPWSGAHTFQTRIRRNVRLAEAPSFGQSIFQYSPDSHGAEDYRRLAEEVTEGRVSPLTACTTVIGRNSWAAFRYRSRSGPIPAIPYSHVADRCRLNLSPVLLYRVYRLQRRLIPDLPRCLDKRDGRLVCIAPRAPVDAPANQEIAGRSVN